MRLERYQSSTSVHRGLVRKISSIDTPDDSTVVLNLSEPWPDALVTLGTRITTIHPRELVDDGSIDRNAVGTGPMILTELADDRAIFEKNPDYWRQEVLLDGFEILSIPDLWRGSRATVWANSTLPARCCPTSRRLTSCLRRTPTSAS